MKRQTCFLCGQKMTFWLFVPGVFHTCNPDYFTECDYQNVRKIVASEEKPLPIIGKEMIMKT